MQSGKLIHCNGIVECVEPEERGYVEENNIDPTSFRNIFFKDFQLDYILDYCLANGIHFHIATHAIRTSSCQEKADITGLPLERVIKGLYLEDTITNRMYGLFIPGTKSSSDIRLRLAKHFGIADTEVTENNKIKKAGKEFLDALGIGIEKGTVHPFVNALSFANSSLETIFFDEGFLEKRRIEGGLDDFSFTAHPSTGYDNHRLSIQINYHDAYSLLKAEFAEGVSAIELI